MKLIKNGSSHMVTIPIEYIEQLKWDSNTEVFVNIDPRTNEIIVKEK
jgi:antitoxin component of MazEF toxin-antitoxin module